MKRTCRAVLSGAFICACAAGCETTQGLERHGKTFYLDGAGNWGIGTRNFKQGLREAGFRGDIELFAWTSSFNPLVDQLNVAGAKRRAASLARRIEKYHQAYPDNEIHVVAMSAGTGVAAWAVEQLNDDTRVSDMVLLSSSLSHDYNVAQALTNIEGKVYVYHSPRDAVLEAVKLIGTIDGKRGVPAAGAVGLSPPDGLEDRVVNIPWSKRWRVYGWHGGHSDSTSRPFVRYEVARHILDSRRPENDRPQRLTGATVHVAADLLRE